MFWPVLVLVLVLKIPVSQVLVLVLVLKNWFWRNWYWYWYWPQKAFIPKPAADTQMAPINPNCKFQTIQKCLYNSSLPLYGGFKAFLRMLYCRIYSQYWYWYWGIGVLGLYWNWYWYWTFPYLGIGIGIGIELRPIWSIGIGIGIDLGPLKGIGIGIGLAKLVLSHWWSQFLEIKKVAICSTRHISFTQLLQLITIQFVSSTIHECC